MPEAFISNSTVTTNRATQPRRSRMQNPKNDPLPRQTEGGMATEPVQLNAEHREKLNRAFMDGALVILSIGQQRWSTKLTPELIQKVYQMDIMHLQQQLASAQDILGEESKKIQRQIAELQAKVDQAAQLPENFKLGRVMLLPEGPIKAIEHVENLARGFLDRNSFEFGGETRARFRFIHKKHLLDVLVGLRDFRQKYFAAVDKLIEDYESLKSEMQKNYPDQWPLIEPCYPQQAAIREKYYFVYEPRAMTFPKTLEGLDLEDLARKESTDKEYREKAEAALEEVRNQASRQASQFVEEALRSVRGSVVKVFQSVIKKIQDKKDITETNVKSLKQVFDYVGKMDFLNDRAFHEQLKTVKAQLDATRSFKDNQSAVKALEAALSGAVSFVDRTTDDAAAQASRNYFQRNLDI